MQVMVVGRRAEQRWALAGALDQAPALAAPPELAASRLAHPSTDPPDAVVLLVDDDRDLAWLRRHRQRSVRSWVPVVALVSRAGLAPAVRTAGAAGVLQLETPADVLAGELREVLAEVTAPAVVITLDSVRTA